jgi:spore coat polysaccharide biosynthesis protein SpsF (cytidylyltransferase family)
VSDAICIVQARMGSSRLPGKVLADVGGRPLVAHVLERAAAIGVPVRLATSTRPDDDALAREVASLGVEVVRGSFDDVLDRFAGAVPAGVRYVVRVTADCPLLDPRIGRAALDALRTGAADYVSNTVRRTFPDGLDVEAFTAEALHAAWTESAARDEREHVTPFIWRRPDRFRVWQIVRDGDLSEERWTVDTQEDLDFVREVDRRLGRREGRMSMEAVLTALEGPPPIRRRARDAVR